MRLACLHIGSMSIATRGDEVVKVGFLLAAGAASFAAAAAAELLGATRDSNRKLCYGKVTGSVFHRKSFWFHKGNNQLGHHHHHHRRLARWWWQNKVVQGLSHGKVDSNCNLTPRNFKEARILVSFYHSFPIITSFHLFSVLVTRLSSSRFFCSCSLITGGYKLEGRIWSRKSSQSHTVRSGGESSFDQGLTTADI